MKYLLGIVVALAAALLILGWPDPIGGAQRMLAGTPVERFLPERAAGGSKPSQSRKFITAPVTRGVVARTVSASAVVRAVVTVNVGAQVSGIIKTLEADFNTEVRADEVIARIDPAPFEARLDQAEAEKSAAHADIAMQRATLDELAAETKGRRAALSRAEAELERRLSLEARGSSTQRDVELAEADAAEARAQVEAAAARIASQKARIDLALARLAERDAAVRLRRFEMDNTLIRSPVDGVVVHRNVEAGQTVASSLEAPVLFQIAQDLSRMQLNISIDEADIGRVRVGQKVDFTVDAYPNQSFAGVVRQIRKAGSAGAAVVTYTVVADFDNPDLLLLPGMTADVNIVTARRDDALRAPTTAFYFSPPGVERGRDWRVWVLDDDGEPRPVAVEFGIYDESHTEILGGLKPGQQVIVGLAPEAEEDAGGWLPFGL